MTNKNIDKFPETYTVSYYNPETEENIDLNQEQLQEITGSSQFKVINKGESYQSWKEFTDNPAYGPGFWDNFLKPVLSGVIAVSYAIPPLAPVGMAVSVGVGVTGLAMRELSDDPEVKKAGKEMCEVVGGAMGNAEDFGKMVNGARAANQISRYNSR